jgi:hypothetical protein
MLSPNIKSSRFVEQFVREMTLLQDEKLTVRGQVTIHGLSAKGIGVQSLANFTGESRRGEGLLEKGCAPLDAFR